MPKALDKARLVLSVVWPPACAVRRGNHLLPSSRPNAAGLTFCRSSIDDCRPCRLRATCFSPAAQRRSVLLNNDHPALLRTRRKRLAWGERERALHALHRGRVEGVHGEAKTWHGLVRAVRRGLGNQTYLTAAVIYLKRLAAAILRALFRLAAGPPHRSPALATA